MLDPKMMQGMKPKRNVVGAPIPGQSLTREPGAAPYEQPPKFVEPEKALDYLMPKILNGNFAHRAANLSERGVNVEALADTLLIGGFAQGLWTPDVAALIAVPVVTAIRKSIQLGGGKPIMRGETDEYKEEVASKLLDDTTPQEPNGSYEDIEDDMGEEEPMGMEDDASTDADMGIMMPTMPMEGADNAV